MEFFCYHSNNSHSYILPSVCSFFYLINLTLEISSWVCKVKCQQVIYFLIFNNYSQRNEIIIWIKSSFLSYSFSQRKFKVCNVRFYDGFLLVCQFMISFIFLVYIPSPCIRNLLLTCFVHHSTSLIQFLFVAFFTSELFAYFLVGCHSHR